MSFASSFDDKERVRQAIDIVDLVGSYLQLRREGRGYKAICPWHDDTRPSLQVNPDRQSFKCWVCDLGGDIFSFVMKIENIDFPEALAMLADRAGITLTPRQSEGRGTRGEGREAGNADEKRTLYQAAAWAEQQFAECLMSAPEAESARRYLDDRGISDESIHRYHLGFSPDRWDWLIKQALHGGFSPAVLEKIGLLIRRDGGGHYDRFRGRVIFSIRDVQGRPVAIGGRVLPEHAATNPAKYVNSPETPLFSKSSMLYGLDLARDAITKSRTAVVMEGYTDCIVARQFGFENVLAVLGTALGERHIRLLRRFADRIVLVLDGDEAGQKRTGEVLSLFVAEQVDLRIVTLPDELDPCDFLLERGADAFRKLLDSPVDALEHAFRMATRGLDIATMPHQAQVALDGLLQTIAKAPRLREGTTSETRIRQWAMMARLARMFGIDEAVLRGRLSELREKQRSAKNTVSAAGSSGGTLQGDSSANAPVAFAALNPWDRELLEILLLEPEAVAAVAEVIRPEQLMSEASRRIYLACCRLAAAGATPDFQRLLLEFDDPRYKNLLVELDEQGHAKRSLDAAARLRELLDAFRCRDEDRRTRDQARAVEEKRLAADEELDVLQQLIEQKRNRQGISAPTDG
ncbi:MAG TPA: DNA primase [Pirellulales bacterium]|nr:DNA primase [Pirellulales bacterium]